ncbi:MAG: tetratricopeptide repeat protein, partial [Lachnospiraceae bacterium]|nr:tetratricopeptide repeat protein [Lachnospiraceae bacterium]
EGLSAYIKSVSISDQNEINTVTTELENYLRDHEVLIDDIIESLKEELHRDNFNANLWYECGYLLSTAGRYDEALEYLDEVIDLDPLYFDAYVQRSFVNNRLENYKASINDISIMLHHQDTLQYHIYRADYFYNDGNYNEAIEDYILAANNGSNESAYCYYSCGQSCYRLEDYASAAFYYDKAISEELPDGYKASCYSECGDVYYNLGCEEYDNENTERGNEYFKSALDRYYEVLNCESSDDERANCYYWAGITHSVLGDEKSALSDYEAACEYSDEAEYRDARNRCKKHLMSLE